jgi:phage-related minor tail protein
VLTQAASEPNKSAARTILIHGAEIVVETKPVANVGDTETEDRKRQLNTLIGLSEKFGDSLSNAFAKNIAQGKKFDNVLKSMGQSLVETGLRLAVAPLQMALSQSVKGMMTGSMQGSLPLDGGGLLDGLAKGLGSIFGSLFGPGGSAFAKGGAFSRGMVMPFAQGGVIGAPTYFPLGRGLGLMGEQGAEAVMPLSRGPDGRLGVRSGGGGRPVSVTVNVSTPDAESFRRSEAQVSAALARAVARGQRGM